MWLSQAVRRLDLLKDLQLPFLQASAAATTTRERCTAKPVQFDPHSSILEGISSVSDLQGT